MKMPSERKPRDREAPDYAELERLIHLVPTPHVPEQKQRSTDENVHQRVNPNPIQEDDETGELHSQVQWMQMQQRHFAQ